MRKKLIELLDYATERFRFNAWENTDKIADFLIENGVTIPVQDDSSFCLTKPCRDAKPKE